MSDQLHRHRHIEAVGGAKPSAILLDVLRDFTFHGVRNGDCEESKQNDETKDGTQKPVFAFPQGELHCFFGQTRKTELTSLDKETVQ